MIGKWYEKNFAKFEAKKRAKLGDKAFLEKYIKSFETSATLMKIFIPCLLVLWVLNIVLESLMLATKGYSGHSVFLITLWSIALACWIFVALTYYLHHFKFYANKIKEWNKELQALNNANLKPQANNNASNDVSNNANNNISNGVSNNASNPVNSDANDASNDINND